MAILLYKISAMKTWSVWKNFLRRTQGTSMTWNVDCSPGLLIQHQWLTSLMLLWLHKHNSHTNLEIIPRRMDLIITTKRGGEVGNIWNKMFKGQKYYQSKPNSMGFREFHFFIDAKIMLNIPKVCNHLLWKVDIEMRLQLILCKAFITASLVIFVVGDSEWSSPLQHW